MFILFFFVFLTQFFTFWIFEPLASFLENVLEVNLLPIFVLSGLILLFSVKNIKQN